MPTRLVTNGDNKVATALFVFKCVLGFTGECGNTNTSGMGFFNQLWWWRPEGVNN